MMPLSELKEALFEELNPLRASPVLGKPEHGYNVQSRSHSWYPALLRCHE